MTRPDDAGNQKIEVTLDEPVDTPEQGSNRPQGEAEGAIPPGAVEVYIDKAVLESTWEHVLTNRRTELGGVLIGRRREADGTFTHITNWLDARHTTTTSGSLTFTHDAWADIAQRMSDMDPDDKIVGWYHSHPGHGVFMSGQDRFIHNNFFANDWQCALVIDPIKNDRGLFQLVNGQIVRTGYWCVPDKPVFVTQQDSKPVAVETPPQQDGLHEAASDFLEAGDHIASGIEKFVKYSAQRIRNSKGPLGRNIDKKA